MKCYLTGNKVCNLGIEEKRNQIFIAYNYKYKNVEKIIEDAIIPALDELNIIYKIAKLEISNKDFFCKICELIQQSKYFLANLTNPTFNVGLELGLALGLNKETILIASNRTKLPSDLVRQEVIFYGKDLNKLKENFISCLNTLIKKNN
jgi:nucleoside-triphosphatase THEP1